MLVSPCSIWKMAVGEKIVQSCLCLLQLFEQPRFVYRDNNHILSSSSDGEGVGDVFFLRTLPLQSLH